MENKVIMKYPKNFYNLMFVIHDLGDSILRKINDYENNIENKPLIKKDFYNIDFVYMFSILLDMGKLLSVTGSDKSGLKEIEKISPDDSFKDRVKRFRKTHKDVILKIAANRNKIIAHVDISDVGSYMNMGFSEVEIKRKIEDVKKYYKTVGIKSDDSLTKIISSYKSMKSSLVKIERYSPSDFTKDIPELRIMVRGILEMINDLNIYFYNFEV